MAELTLSPNLYYVTSLKWDLRALKVVLQSAVARLFIATYSTQMRGGYLRFQAQYLRRIRVPDWEAVPEAIKSALIKAGEKGDTHSRDQAVFELYNLTTAERTVLGGTGV